MVLPKAERSILGRIIEAMTWKVVEQELGLQMRKVSRAKKGRSHPSDQVVGTERILLWTNFLMQVDKTFWEKKLLIFTAACFSLESKRPETSFRW